MIELSGKSSNNEWKPVYQKYQELRQERAERAFKNLFDKYMAWEMPRLIEALRLDYHYCWKEDLVDSRIPHNKKDVVEFYIEILGCIKLFGLED